VNPEVVALAKQGIPPREIAQRLGLGLGGVRVALSIARRTDPDVPKFRPRLGLNNLKDPALISAVKAHIEAGQSQREVAAALGIPIGSVATIMDRVRFAAAPEGFGGSHE